MKKALRIIQEAIGKTVENLLPIPDLLHSCLASIPETAPVPETIPETEKNEEKEMEME